MEEGDTVIALSESQEMADDEFRVPLDCNHSCANVGDRHDEYSDIYYDRSYQNVDEISLCNLSNLPKDVNLEFDQVSEDQIFIKPSHSDNRMIKDYNNERYQHASMMFSNSVNQGTLTNVARDYPSRFNENSNVSNYINNNLAYEYKEECKMEDYSYSNSYVPESFSTSYNDGFVKNEGKMIFKITRFNKLTQKEKIITKSKRIISKCPHTSMKYYAKGMCKKCYHSYGREKKAFICGHSDKPLYAKGYCKQCYLSRYKEQMYSKLSFRSPKCKRQRKSNSTGLDLNSSEIEPVIIRHEFYPEETHHQFHF